MCRLDVTGSGLRLRRLKTEQIKKNEKKEINLNELY